MVFDMKNVIDTIYDGNLYPLEQITDTKQMKEISSYISRHRADLLSKLDEEGKETLEKLVDNFYEYCSLRSHETFNYAIRLGANLIIELTHKGDNNEQK